MKMRDRRGITEKRSRKQRTSRSNVIIEARDRDTKFIFGRIYS